MPKITCPTCGQPMQGGECPRCRAASAIAKPEHAEQAKVTQPAASDGAIREGEPPHWPAPSIRKDAPHLFRSWLPTIIVVVIVLTCAGLLIPAVQKVREAERRTHAINNMKQIGLCFHSYHDVNKRFPTPKMIRRADGIAQEVELSWRVEIIPYIESSTFFREFDTTKSWDHPRHKHVQDQMPLIYVSPRLDDTGSTTLARFQIFTGPDTLFPKNEPRSLQDVKDGADRTLLFAEAAAAVLWMKPGDMSIRPDQPLPIPEEALLVATVSGEIRHIRRDKIGDTILRQLIDPNDGKPDPGWDQ